MNPTPGSLSIITAVVAPALLILACSSLITTTANRLSLLLDRVRLLTHEMEALLATHSGENKQAFIMSQLGRGATRAMLLQRALATLYLALGTLILTSVGVGISAVAGLSPRLIAVMVLVSVSFLFYASTLLIRESRVALTAVSAEMKYVRSLLTHH